MTGRSFGLCLTGLASARPRGKPNRPYLHKLRGLRDDYFVHLTKNPLLTMVLRNRVLKPCFNDRRAAALVEPRPEWQFCLAKANQESGFSMVVI